MAGIKHHELFKGLICFGGWLSTDWLTEETIKAASDLKVFIAHGKEGRVVEYENAIKAKEVLQNNGYSITFYDFEGSHRVSEEAAEEAVKWMSGR